MCIVSCLEFVDVAWHSTPDVCIVSCLEFIAYWYCRSNPEWRILTVQCIVSCLVANPKDEKKKKKREKNAGGTIQKKIKINARGIILFSVPVVSIISCLKFVHVMWFQNLIACIVNPVVMFVKHTDIVDYPQRQILTI